MLSSQSERALKELAARFGLEVDKRQMRKSEIVDTILRKEVDWRSILLATDSCRNGVEFLQRLGVRQGYRVLDIAMGEADMTLMVAVAVGRKGKVVGIDFAPTQTIGWTRAKKTVDRAGFQDRICFARCDASLMPFQNERFDYAVSSGALHWMRRETITSALTEARRVLKKEALIFVEGIATSPKNRAQEAWLHCYDLWYESGEAMTWKGYESYDIASPLPTEEEITDYFRKSGFTTFQTYTRDYGGKYEWNLSSLRQRIANIKDSDKRAMLTESYLAAKKDVERYGQEDPHMFCVCSRKP